MMKNKMIFSMKLVSLAIVLFAVNIRGNLEVDRSATKHENQTLTSDHNKTTNAQSLRLHPHHNVSSQKYSSRIAGSRYSSYRPVFGIRTFPLGKIHPSNAIVKAKTTASPSTEKVLDFRIEHPDTNDLKAILLDSSKDDEDDDDDEKRLDEDDLKEASAGGGKQKKEADDDEEKTLAQQVADGKYGLIQNELFANGSKRPGILSYKSNNEVPKDTKENLGGLDKDEIWLAEDHILVLRGGNYKNQKENEPPESAVWPPIDNYLAPKRQVKIPKNPEIPPPFPVQLSDDGPVEFVKGQNNPSFLPPVIPPLPPFAQDTNKTIPLPFTVVPIPPLADSGNNSLPLPVPPHFLPPFLSNFPPGATFVAPPSNNNTEIDEDDPSIYYPPKYDFIYPLDNTTAVPPGPLVPGIILPPPPDFFSLLKPETESNGHNETDNSINSVYFVGPKYLPALRKPGRTRLHGNVHDARPSPSPSNITNTNSVSETDEPDHKPPVAYVYPENSKQKPSTTPSYSNSLRTNSKTYANKYHENGFNSPIFVPNGPNRPVYHPLPTTSPKPNHITLPPTTKSLPKQILIITTPESTQKAKGESNHPSKKPVETNKYGHLAPEIHPLRSLLKPNVTVSYNGKYGHLPPPANYQPVKPETDVTIIRGHYVTQPPLTKGSKVPSTDVNSITVTPIPVVKKVRIQQMLVDKPNVSVPPPNPTKATLYFYEETSTTEEPKREQQKPEVPAEPIIEAPAIKPDEKPITPYYYATHSTGKTPIRQFLEETFHSSNVLTRKPQIAHVNNAEIITHNGYSEVPKMKHLNYGTPISSPRPVVKYHYVTDGNTVVIPTPKIQDLEIKNSGSSGLQTVHLDPVAPVRPLVPSQPVVVEPYIEPAKKPEEHQQQPAPPQIVTASPIEYNTAEGPFVPSNYYATVRPEHVHFTSQEQTLVDDITKNYFTIFGQKINSPSTTPLTPIKQAPTKTKTKQESGLSFISDDGRNYSIQQVHDSNKSNPSKSSSSFFTGEKPKASPRPRPQSNFEKYLKELTGEDQRDYIISGVFPIKVKKGKGFLPNGIPAHLLPQHQVVYENDVTLTRPKIQYQPNLSTTLRPLAGVSIKSPYLPPIPPTIKPYDVYQQQVKPQNVHFNPALQQYFQELTALTSPTTKRPVRVKKPNNEYLPQSHSPTPYQGVQDVKSKPISLANDYLVNYKPPRPEVEPNAEIINIPGGYDNIKIVDSPDLSRNANLPPFAPAKPPIPFEIGKTFFPSLPRAEFFGPRHPHPNGGNAFVSYNLPGNGGHFFFLTPQQVVEKANEQDAARGHDKAYKRVDRSHERSNRKYSGGHDTEYTSSDYLRRRRKKP